MDSTHFVLGILNRLQDADDLKDEIKKVRKEIVEGMALHAEGKTRIIPNQIQKKVYL